MATQQSSICFGTLGVLFAVVICLVGLGCQSINLPTTESVAATATNSEATTEQEAVAQYQLQVIPSFGSPTVERINISSPLTVEDVLNNAELPERFKKMKITLGRIVKNGDGGRLLKLPVGYEVRSKSVRPEQNYQILPGDTLTVSPDKSDTIDKAIKSLTGGIN